MQDTREQVNIVYHNSVKYLKDKMGTSIGMKENISLNDSFFVG